MDINCQNSAFPNHYINRIGTSEQGRIKIDQYFSFSSALKLLVCLSLLTTILMWQSGKTDELYQRSKNVVAAPKIDDIYILDHRLYQQDTRPNENYRIAKVVDITGDTITLLFGNMLYPTLRSSEQAIRYGQLRYHDYFETMRYNWEISEVDVKLEEGLIAQAHRPKLGQLFGNSVHAGKRVINSKIFIPGKRENQEGESWLLQTHIENHLAYAQQAFLKGAELDYVPAKVNLAQLYLTEEYMDKAQALYWLKAAALKSDKAAILKYEIVCQQVADCYWNDFVDELVAAGVNIKLRSYKPQIK